MTNEQVRKRTGYSRASVANFALDKKIAAVHVGKNHPGRGVWIYDPQSVEDFVRRHGVKESKKGEGE